MPDKQDIHDNWYETLSILGYERTGTYNLREQPELARQLGTELFDHMVNAVHDLDWEGYSDAELVGVRAFFEDLLGCVKDSKGIPR